jgi:hypothetical protein
MRGKGIRKEIHRCREVNASWRRRVHFAHFISFHMSYIHVHRFFKYNTKNISPFTQPNYCLTSC